MISIRGDRFIWALTICWAPTAVLVKHLLASYSPLLIVALATLIASIIMMGWQLARQQPVFLPNKHWPNLLIIGFFSHSLPFTLQCYALNYIESIYYAVLIGAIPITTTLLALLILKEQISKTLLCGMVLGFIGVSLLSIPDHSNHNTGYQHLLGIGLSLMGVLSSSLGIISVRKFVPPVTLATPTTQLFLSSLYLIPYVLLFEPTINLNLKDIQVFIKIMWLAIPGTAIAYILYYKILELKPAAYFSMVHYMLPLFKALLGFLILQETAPFSFWFGFLLVLSAVLIVDINRQTNTADTPSN